MIKKLIAFMILATGMAAAQTTPNLGLELPNYQAPNWGVEINYNFMKLDGFLSGGYTLPAFISQGLTLTNLTPNQCVSTDANGKLVTTGAACSTFTLTTTGTSGPATLSGGVLNIPQYNPIPTGTTNQLLYYSAGGTTVTPLTLGTNLSITGGTLNAAGGSTGTFSINGTNLASPNSGVNFTFSPGLAIVNPSGDTTAINLTTQDYGGGCTLGIMGLVGAFTNSSGVIQNQPLCIGDGPVSFAVTSSAATQLQIGVSDNAYFNNSGSLVIAVSINGAAATNVTVLGTSMPWNSTTNPSYSYGQNDGTAPVVAASGLAVGDVVTLTYVSGTTLYQPGATPADANGWLTTPPGSAGRGGATGTWNDGTYGYFPTFYMTVPYVYGGVTSVGLTVPSWLSVSGSPVTGSGTLAVTASTGQTANELLATPNGSSGAVGLRYIAGGDFATLTGCTTSGYVFSPPGDDCIAAGGGGGNVTASTLTPNYFPIATGAAAIANSTVYTGSGNLNVPMPIVVNDGTGTSGAIFTEGTAFAAQTGKDILYADSTNHCLEYSPNGVAFSCLAVQGGTAAFSGLTGGTNSSAAMVVGAGASLVPSGSGTVQANDIAGTVGAGTNISITGSGTQTSPYLINGLGNSAITYSASASFSGTQYFPVGGGAAPSAIESDVYTVSPANSTANSFTVSLSAAPGTGNSIAFTWRVSGASAALSCTISGTATSCSDFTHSVTIAQSADIDVMAVTTGTVTGTPTVTFATSFQASSVVSVPGIAGTALQASSSNTYTVTWPSGAVAGDTAYLLVGGGYAVNPPSGWTVIDQSNGQQWEGFAASRVLSSSDITAGSVTITMTGTYDTAVGLVVIDSGYISTLTYTSEQNATGSASITLNTSGAPTTNDLMIYFGSNRAASTDTVSLGTLQRQVNDGANASACIYTGSPASNYGVSPTFSYSSAGTGNYQIAIAVRKQ